MEGSNLDNTRAADGRAMTSKHGSFTFHETRIEDVLVVEPTIHGDERGFFMETYKQCDFEAAGLPYRFVQENQSRSRRGVLRGLHFQQTRPQAKLIRVLAGEIFDVAVDLRAGSKTYGESVCVTLSGERHNQLLIPRGFAHGFQVVSDFAEIVYMCDDYYAPDDEGGLAYNDPDLAISWPIPDPIMSARDQRNPTLAASGIAFKSE